jgi:GTPase SAR1 family protein
MGGQQSAPEEVDLSKIDRTQDVELNLLEQQVEDLFKFKILLLGAGESGKSTIVKQIKLIHQKRLTPKELQIAGNSLHQNVVDCMKALLNARKNFATYELDDEGKKTEEELFEWDENTRLNQDMGKRILKLFNSEALQKTYARRSEFWLLDSFSYYIKSLDRFVEPDWVPTEEDAVMARIRTTGIVVTNLEQKFEEKDKPVEYKDIMPPEKLLFQVVDVGGQRNERKKWIHCFDDVRCVLFCDNLAGYNQVLFEDSTKNRMHESLELFNKVTYNKIFEQTPIFLFLNKKDLFEHMIKEVDMQVAFPEYKGGKDLNAALDFIKTQFQRQLPPKKEVHIQVVSACFKREIRVAFEEVKNVLFDMNKKKIMDEIKQIREKQKQLVVARHAAARRGPCSCMGGGGAANAV